MQKNQTQTQPSATVARNIVQVILWLFFAYVLILYTLYHYNYILSSPQNLLHLWDFKLFYTGSLDFWSGGTPYQWSATLPFERIIDKNGNSPVGALIYLPLGWLSLPVAGLLWTVISIALFLWGISYIWRVFKPNIALHWRMMLLILLFFSYPVALTIQLGTWGMIIAFLDFAAWYYARKGADKQAGILVGLAVAIRWQPFPLFLLFLVLRRWSVVIYTLATVAVAAGLSFLILGTKSFVDFWNMVFKLGSDGRLQDPLDGSLRAFWGRIFENLANIGIRLEFLSTPLWIISVLTLLGFSVWRCRKLNFDYAYSLMLIVGLLLAPTTWLHYHIILLLPMALIGRKYLWPVLAVCFYWFIINVAVLLDLYGPLNVLFASLMTGYLLVLWFVLYRGEPTKVAESTPALQTAA